MAIRNIRQGDCDWADVPRTDGEPMDGTGIWEGAWAIIDHVGGTVSASGSMELSADKYYFQRRIRPEDTLACILGDYILVTQIKNDILLYSSEISHENIKIIAQGIV